MTPKKPCSLTRLNNVKLLLFASQHTKVFFMFKQNKKQKGNQANTFFYKNTQKSVCFASVSIFNK